MSRKGFLGEFEQMVLLAILRLGSEAYGTRISQELENKAGRRVSRGQLYSALDRMERKALVRWEIAPTTSERGGHPRRCFEVTEAGVEALRTSKEALVRLWSGLDETLGEGAS